MFLKNLRRKCFALESGKQKIKDNEQLGDPGTKERRNASRRSSSFSANSNPVLCFVTHYASVTDGWGTLPHRQNNGGINREDRCPPVYSHVPHPPSALNF